MQCFSESGVALHWLISNVNIQYKQNKTFTHYEIEHSEMLWVLGAVNDKGRKAAY